ncbi:Excitatory amino acid transporter 2 [Desmophyllum pertusum]|uniref:Amino acid transporter n=1 Tax=Desmophyllum pertusum TaxID=174260 RepID=A0A9X0D976_9CNID|nr:Excitatory amino acid transporter 2 [Desmophyllum pertusum]
MPCNPLLGVSNRHRTRCGGCCNAFYLMVKRNLLLVLLVTGAFLGFAIGAIINEPVNRITDPEKKATVIMLIGFPGELFMNMLKMIMIPLIVASLITAVSTLNPDVAGRIGRRTMIYYLATMVLAAILGMSLVLSIRPGVSGNPDTRENVQGVKYRNLDSLLDMIRNCFPSNLVEAAVTQKKTKYVTVTAKFETYNVTGASIHLEPDEIITAVHNNGTANITTIRKEIHAGSDTVPAGMLSSGGMNILGLTVFSIVLGIVLGRLREKGRPLVKFFSALNEAVMMIVLIIMWLAPVGVCSLVAARIAAMDDVLIALAKLGLYMVTVMCGLLIHSLIVIPLVFFVVTRKNPYVFMKGLREALMTAFGISSSAATLPTTIRCVEENNNIDPRISRFMLPLGATVNMDGSALYGAVTTIFVAQLNDIPLSPGRVVVACLISVAIAVGAAGIPVSGVMTIIALQAVNLPLHDIGLILAVDWLLDRCRTAVNVLGDAMGTGIVDHLSRDDLKYKSTDCDTIPLAEHRKGYNAGVMLHSSNV